MVVQKTSPVNFKLRWLSTGKTLNVPVHVNRLKLATIRYEQPTEVPDEAQLEPLDMPEEGMDSGLPNDHPLITQNEEGQQNVQVQPGESQVNNGGDTTQVLHDNEPEASTSGENGHIDQASGKKQVKKKVHKQKRKTNYYEVQEIIGKRSDENGNVTYCIHWKGFPASARTFEKWQNLNAACKKHINTTAIPDI